MSDWIYFSNMKLSYIDLYSINEELKSMGFVKKAQPALNLQAKKALGYNQDSINDEFLKVLRPLISGIRSHRKNKGRDYFLLRAIESYKFYLKNGNTYLQHSLNDLKSVDKKLFLEIQQKESNLKSFINNHEKTQKYIKENSDFYKKREELIKERCFVKSKYNVPGTLVVLEDLDGIIKTFLIGSVSNISKSFRSDVKILRCKRLLSDEDIQDLIIFN